MRAHISSNLIKRGETMKQITADSGSGAVPGDFKSEAADIGPAIMWMPQRFNDKAAFIAQWISEFDVENRLERQPYIYLLCEEFLSMFGEDIII